MKRIFMTGIIIFFVLGFITLTDAEAFYVSGKLGLAQQIDEYNETNFGRTKWEFDKGPNLSVAFGGTLKMFRLEGELSYRIMDFESRTFIPTGAKQNLGGDQTQLQAMFNAIWQIMPQWRLSPFIGGGIGFTHISWNNVNASIDDSDTVFTYQGILGASFRITSNFFIEGTYYYVNSNDVELKDNTGAVGNLDNQQLNILTFGVRYNF